MIVVAGEHGARNGNDGAANDGNEAGHEAVDRALAPILSFEQAFDGALAILRGTKANFVLCILTMIASFAAAVIGFLLMTANNTCARGLTILTTMFLVSQTFTVAKAARDTKMANLLFDHRRRPAEGEDQDQDQVRNNPYAVEYQFLLPTWQYKVEVAVTFVFTLGATIFAIAQVEVVDPEWFGFAIFALVWVLQCALCLAKTVRDRKEAAIWENTPREHPQSRLPLVLSACVPTLAHQAVVWIAFPTIMIFTLVYTWVGFQQGDASEIPVERKGFLSIALLFNASACFHMAKLARDRAIPQKRQELGKQIPFQLMVALSFVVSLVVPLIGLLTMPLEPKQRAVLILGFLMCASSTMHLAKLVRDKQELALLNERLQAPQFPVLPNAPGPDLMAQAAAQNV